jgi:Rho GTPase-activating protein RGD1
MHSHTAQHCTPRFQLPILILLRVSGRSSVIQKLRYEVDQHPTGVDLTVVGTDYHSVTGLLKLYLRELPEPLMTYKLYKAFLEYVTPPISASSHVQ